MQESGKRHAHFVERGLAAHGWNFVNIDDCWQGVRGGKYGALQGNERFPDMKALADYIHSLGLRFGLYSTPWIGTYAGFRGGAPTGDAKNGCSCRSRNGFSRIRYSAATRDSTASAPTGPARNGGSATMCASGPNGGSTS